MTDNLTTLRQAGFFKEHAALTDDELIDLLAKKRKDEYSDMFGYDYEPEDYGHITELLALDDKKFLDIDLESDVCDGNNVYVSVLEDFSKASNGHFKPTNIEEVWDSEEGPVRVSFTSNGRQVVFEPEYMDDWIDGGVFDVINEEMSKTSNERFHVCAGPDEEWFGQNIIHIRLSQEEKQLLKDKLNWSFPE